VVRTPAGAFQIEVLRLSDMRGPAPVAQAMYFEPEASREARRLAAEQRRLAGALGDWPEGRPTKRDRRRIIQFRSQS
jgi:ribosome-associated heat shock protein Hsp15